jgi:cytoskeletal protein CcmA (bactofilin family)
MWSPTNQSSTETAPRSSSLNPLKNSVIDTPAATLPEPIPVAAPRNATLNSAEQASIGKSLVIKGDVSGSESLYIEGKVHGSISLSGGANRVTVGKSGVVVADLSAREIVVMGKVQGNLVASDRVDIRNEGSLAGDVVTQRITIEDGAFFKGSIDVRKA